MKVDRISRKYTVHYLVCNNGSLKEKQGAVFITGARTGGGNIHIKCVQQEQRGKFPGVNSLDVFVRF